MMESKLPDRPPQHESRPVPCQSVRGDDRLPEAVRSRLFDKAPFASGLPNAFLDRRYSKRPG
jgi:hypothetical protein